MTWICQVLDVAIQRDIDRVPAALRKLPARCPIARSVRTWPLMVLRIGMAVDYSAEYKLIQNHEVNGILTSNMLVLPVLHLVGAHNARPAQFCKIVNVLWRKLCHKTVGFK